MVFYHAGRRKRIYGTRECRRGQRIAFSQDAIQGVSKFNVAAPIQVRNEDIQNLLVGQRDRVGGGMAMRSVGTGVKISGISETVGNLRGLRRLAFEKVASRAFEPVSRQFIDGARANLAVSGSVETKALIESIGVVVRVNPQSKMVRAFIGPRNGFNRKDERGIERNPLKYAHLIEFGVGRHSLTTSVDMKKASGLFGRFVSLGETITKRELRDKARAYLFRRDVEKKGGAGHPGFAARPFMRPAWDRGAFGAMETLKAEIGFMIEDIAKEVAQIPEYITKRGTRVMSSRGRGNR